MLRVVSVWLVVCTVCVPALAAAQGAVSGIVRDAAGAAVAQAVIEAASDALIEGIRRTTTDGSGRYRLDGLAPGSYRVRFARGGFRTAVLNGVRVSTARTVQASVELAAGISSDEQVLDFETGVIDETATTPVRVLDGEMLRALPLSGSYNALLAGIPGVMSDSDVTLDPTVREFTLRGGRAAEGRLQVDGLLVGAAPYGHWPGFYVSDPRHAQEVAVASGGVIGGGDTAGLRLNIVPQAGGNRHRGSLFATFGPESLLATNVDPRTGAMGAFQRDSWSVAADAGGPLLRDRLWYTFTGRIEHVNRLVPGQFANLNAGDPNRWTWEADTTQPVDAERRWENAAVRLTWLASRRHRFGAFFDGQALCRTCDGIGTEFGVVPTTVRVSPEAIGVGDVDPLRLMQGIWSSPAGDRLLFDAGVSRHTFGWGNSQRDDVSTQDLVRVLDTSLRLVYRSQDWEENLTSTTQWHATARLFVGGHALTARHEGLAMADDRTFHSNGDSLTYNMSFGFPSSLTQVISPFSTRTRAGQLSAVVEDRWTSGRLTVEAALRYDRARSWYPTQAIGPTRFVTGYELSESSGVDAYEDLTPRVGAAYDVSGAGRTVVRVSLAQYLDGVSTTGIYGDMNPARSVVRSVSRGWFDFDGDRVPDCNLLGAFSNGECGGITNLNFGYPVPTTTVVSSLSSGFGVRPSDWNLSASVERQIGRRASFTGAYYRRWFDGFTVTDNFLVAPSNVRTFTVTAPNIPGLPGGGGYTIGPLYEIPAIGFQQGLVSADDYGSQSLYSDSFEATFHGRLPFGLSVTGGLSTARQRADSCEIRAAIPESAPLNPFCDTSSGWLTQVRTFATYLIPRVDVQVGAVYQNRPGPMLSGQATVFTGRGFTTLNLIEPGTMYGDRLSSLDVRLSKMVRVGGVQVGGGLDIFNFFNAATPLAYNPTLTFEVPGRPLTIMSPRLARITGEVRF